MKSAGKARNNGLYRHIRTSKEIIRNLLNDYTEKLNLRIKSNLISQKWAQKFKGCSIRCKSPSPKGQTPPLLKITFNPKVLP